jgi:hypothetical protein
MASRPWRQQGFEQRLDEWIALEHPDEKTRALVGGWLLSRIDDPYEGMRRQEGFDNLWFGVIPGTRGSVKTVVACSLWIQETEHVVRCDRIATLGWPV